MSTPSKPARASGGGAIFNILTGLFALLSCISIVCTAVIAADPNILKMVGGDALVPVSVPTVANLADMLTANAVVDATTAPGETPATATATVPGDVAFPTFPPTWTATNTPTESPIPPTHTPSSTPTSSPTTEPDTATPTITLTPTNTPRAFNPTATRTRSPFIYTLKDKVFYMPNYGNTANCNWMSIYGQVFDLSGRPVAGVKVHIDGPNGMSVDTTTGTATRFGSSSHYYEFPLGDRPVESTGLYKVQVRTSSGQAASAVYTIDTKGTCDKNLIMVNFERNH